MAQSHSSKNEDNDWGKSVVVWYLIFLRSVTIYKQLRWRAGCPEGDYPTPSIRRRFHCWRFISVNCLICNLKPFSHELIAGWLCLNAGSFCFHHFKNNKVTSLVVCSLQPLHTTLPQCDCSISQPATSLPVFKIKNPTSSSCYLVYLPFHRIKATQGHELQHNSLNTVLYTMQTIDIRHSVILSS